MGKAVKIAYFPSTTPRNVVLESNGIALDNFCIKAITTEDLSGTYLLDATFVIKDEIIDYLQEENILKVKMDYGDEVFRISKVSKSTRYIDIVARQITIADTIAMYLDDVRPTNANGLSALNNILTGADAGEGRVKEIFVNSDITDVSTAYYQNMSMYKAIHDCDQSFLNRWGGEVQRRAYTLTINKSIGANRGVCIREGKNLTGFSADTNIDDLCTRGIGEGYNGIKGNYVYSSKADKYAKVYTKTFEYSNIRLKGDDTEEDSENTYFNTKEEVIKELDRLVALEFSNNVDELKATYNINFVELEKTEEYKNYIQAEKVFLGDTVRVYIPKLDTDIQVRVIEKKYDVLAQKTEELTLSNTAEKSVISMSSIISDLKNQYKNTGNNSIADYIDSIIKAGMKDSYVLVRNGELLAMDTQDVNTATIVARLNKNGLGFSSTGYYGEYTYGFTLDGKINASLISTGILSAILVRSIDGKSWFNLSTGELVLGNGKIIVNNQNGEKVMWVDENGHLSTDTLEVFGDGGNTVNFKGKGGKSVNFKSDDAKSLFINFLRGTDTNTRIGVYAQDALSDRSYQFFIEPGSTTQDNEPMVIIRGANSTLTENEQCILQVHGDIEAIRGLYIGQGESRLNVLDAIENLKARVSTLEGGA